jgi:hypothetical protein
MLAADVQNVGATAVRSPSAARLHQEDLSRLNPGPPEPGVSDGAGGVVLDESLCAPVSLLVDGEYVHDVRTPAA